MSQPVFLSSVTSDFPNYRQWIAEDLRKSDAEVRDQEHFRNRGGLLLKLLDDYIRECRIVIHLIGAKAGWVAKPDEVADLLQRYPDFLQKLPALAPLVSQLSYTQWEAWLSLSSSCRWHRKRCYRCCRGWPPPRSHAGCWNTPRWSNNS